jgi:hypothetical protein
MHLDLRQIVVDLPALLESKAVALLASYSMPIAELVGEAFIVLAN